MNVDPFPPSLHAFLLQQVCTTTNVAIGLHPHNIRPFTRRCSRIKSFSVCQIAFFAVIPNFFLFSGRQGLRRNSIYSARPTTFSLPLSSELSNLQFRLSAFFSCSSFCVVILSFLSSFFFDVAFSLTYSSRSSGEQAAPSYSRNRSVQSPVVVLLILFL